MKNENPFDQTLKGVLNEAEPSVSFTDNVMKEVMAQEQFRAENIRQLNQRMRFASSFIVVMLLLSIVLLLNVEATYPYQWLNDSLSSGDFDVFSSPFYGVGFVAVLFLLVLENMLKKAFKSGLLTDSNEKNMA